MPDRKRLSRGVGQATSRPSETYSQRLQRSKIVATAAMHIARGQLVGSLQDTLTIRGDKRVPRVTHGFERGDSKAYKGLLAYSSNPVTFVVGASGDLNTKKYGVNPVSTARHEIAHRLGASHFDMKFANRMDSTNMRKGSVERAVRFANLSGGEKVVAAQATAFKYGPGGQPHRATKELKKFAPRQKLITREARKRALESWAKLRR